MSAFPWWTSENNPCWLISGAWAWPISGKFIQWKTHPIGFRSIIQAGSWETHPIVNFDFWKTHPKLNISLKIIFKDFRGVTQTDVWKTYPNMDQFSRNPTSSCPDILQKLNRFSPKMMDEFFRNWSRSYQLDGFSRNPSLSHPGKLEFR